MGIGSRVSFRDDDPRGRRRPSSRRRFGAGLAICVALVLAASLTVGSHVGSATPTLSAAGPRTCARGEDRSPAVAAQAQVLLCLVNQARQRRGVRPLVLSRVLSRTAAAKAHDIVRCRDFRHKACGKRVIQAARAVGYRGALGENLYVAEGARAAPGSALDAWLNSTRHRKNILAPKWRSIGIAVRGGADVARIRDGVVWVNHFG